MTMPATGGRDQASRPIWLRERSVGYDAFVSYSHRRDRLLAEALQSELQNFARPWYRTRAMRVFRDETSLSATPGLWPMIERALAASDWLVLMASPASAASPWVRREIDWWLANRTTDHILLALTDGDICWSGEDFDWTATNAIPQEQLSGRFAHEPFWIDLRKLRPSETTDDSVVIERPRLGDIVAEFAAPMRGQEKDALVGEHVRYNRQTKRIVRTVIAVLTTLLVIAAGAAYVAATQRANAVEQARIATARQLAAESEALLATHLDVAQLLAVEGYRMDRNPLTRSALFQAVTASPALVRYLHAGTTVTTVTGSLDGRFAIAGTETGTVVRWDVRQGGGTTIAQLDHRITAVSANTDGSVIVATDGLSAVVWADGLGVTPLSVQLPEQTLVVAVSPSGRFIATPSVPPAGSPPTSATVAVLDRQTGVTDQLTSDHAVRFWLPAEDELLTTDFQGNWDRATVPGLRRRSSVTNSARPAGVHVNVSTVSQNGGFFSFSNGASTIPVWRTDGTDDATDVPDLVALSHGSSPQAVALSNDGKRVAVADAGMIYVSEAARGTPGASPQLALSGNNATNPDGITFLGDSNHLLSASDQTITVWDLNQLSRISQRTVTTIPWGCSGCVPPKLTISPDGNSVAIVDGANQSVTVYNLSQHDEHVLTTDSVLESYAVLGWSDDSRNIFVMTKDGSIEIRRAERDLPVVQRWTGMPPNSYTIALSRDRTRLVQVDDAGKINVWDPQLHRVERTVAQFDGTDSDARVVVDASGSFAAEQGPSGVTLVNLITGDLRTMGTADVVDVAFGTQHLLMQYRDGTFEIWNLAGTKLFRSIRQDLSYRPTTSVVSTPPTSSDSFLAQERSDGTLSVVDISTGGLLGSLGPGTRSVGSKTGLAFTADGRHLFAAVEAESEPDTGVLWRWNVDPSAWTSTACTSAGRNLSPDEWTRYVGTTVPADLACDR